VLLELHLELLELHLELLELHLELLKLHLVVFERQQALLFSLLVLLPSRHQ
jgi:hypothetical protein